MNPETEVQNLLRESGAILKRDTKHHVYELPNGQNFVSAKTPSDSRAGLNDLAVLRKLLACRPVKGAPGERREPRNKPGNQSPPVVHIANIGNLGEKLLAAGAVELTLRAELKRKEAEIDKLRKEESKVNAERAVNAGVVVGVNTWAGVPKDVSEGDSVLKRSCTDCGEQKPVTAFQKVGHRNKPGEFTRMRICAECFQAKRLAGFAKRKAERDAIEAASRRFTCTRCETVKEPELRSKWKPSWCKPCVSDWRKALPPRRSVAKRTWWQKLTAWWTGIF